MNQSSNRPLPAALYAMSAAVLILSAAFLFSSTAADMTNRDSVVAGLILLPFFVLVRQFGFKLRVRGENHSIYPVELLLPLAVVAAAPITIVVARILGELLVVIRSGGMAFHKVVFNFILSSFETAVTFWVVGRVLGANGTTTALGWAFVGLVVAVVTSALNFILLSVAIGFATGRGTFGGLRANASLSLVTVSLGCLIGAIVEWYWPMVIFVVPVLVGSLVLVKDRGRLLARNDNLTRLEEFTTSTVETVRAHDFLVSSLDRIHDAIDPVASYLVRYQPDGLPPVCYSRGDTTGIDETALPAGLDDRRWEAIVGQPEPGHLEAGDEEWLDDRIDEFDDLITASFARDGVTVGTVVLVHTKGERDHFTTEQTQLLGAMVNQLSLSSDVRGLVEELEHAATHDALTGLLNRRGLHEKIVGASSGIAALCDIANFKDVNEALGYDAGNEALRAIATRFDDAAAPAGHHVARFGGDQFAIFAATDDVEVAEETLQEYLRIAGEELVLRDVTFKPVFRLGWLLHSGGIDPVETMRRAEVALNTAKADPPGTLVEYQQEIDSKSSVQLRMLNELSAAIDNDELSVHYQPKLAVKDKMVVGFEALVRWPNKDGGTISPAVFVPLAERQGEGRRLTDFVIRTAMRQAADWRDDGLDLTININVGVRDLLDTTLPNMVGEQLLATQLPPARVVLEITETTMMRDVDTVVRNLERLRQLGVGVSIDDFGTGYSSLSYLARLPITELKVDRSFVSTMRSSEEDRFIVSMAASLGRQLGLDVVAEGVEDIDDLEMLQNLGCGQAQGFGIARPMPGDQVDSWCRTTHFTIRRPTSDTSEPFVRNVLVD